MAVTAAQLKAKVPEFAAILDATVDAAIAEALRRMNLASWGSRLDDGTTYLAAHILKADALGSGLPAGALTSMRAGPFGVSFAIPERFQDMDLAATAYGRRYLSLKDTIFSSHIA